MKGRESLQRDKARGPRELMGFRLRVETQHSAGSSDPGHPSVALSSNSMIFVNHSPGPTSSSLLGGLQCLRLTPERAAPSLLSHRPAPLGSCHSQPGFQADMPPVLPFPDHQACLSPGALALAVPSVRNALIIPCNLVDKDLLTLWGHL